MAIEFLSLDLGCGDFILTNSIAFFYSLGLTSIVYLHILMPMQEDGLDEYRKEYNDILTRNNEHPAS